jgi:2-methylisocitrate lyase-like PEP mutase family enzyme
MPSQTVSDRHDIPTTGPTGPADRCARLRALHVPGAPLVVPNAWDVASARAIAGTGFPVVGTTSAGVAAVLGYPDHEGAPGGQMLAAAARITGAVDVPVTVDAEAGYGMAAAELVQALQAMGAAGCNLEDTDHAHGRLHDPAEHAEWLRDVRGAAAALDYPLVINARVDVFLAAMPEPDGGRGQIALVDEALRRAHAYAAAGADCVFPIVLWQPDALTAFLTQAPGPVNILRIPPAPSEPELADLGVARISYGALLHHEMTEHLVRRITPLLPPPLPTPR